MKNIEIKAKIDNIDEVEKKASAISDHPLVIIKQHDVFFKLPSDQATRGGRLKLRHFENGNGQLIYYERSDATGPKLSTYSIVQLDSLKTKELRDILTISNGILGTIDKTRHLYMNGQTRIHIDRVNGLGNYLELEVVLDEDDIQDENKGYKIAENLMKDLGIAECALVSGAYLDIVLQK